MLADAEVITVGTEILTQLPIGTFIIKLNHRALLDAIFEISGRLRYIYIVYTYHIYNVHCTFLHNGAYI